ncbi:MAG: hypothetical protein ACT4P7_20520 [Gemmatimonadaceae bacterium]
MSRAVRLTLLVALSALPPACLAGRSLGAQQRAVRFEITSVSDTTLSFQAGMAAWVRAGQMGRAVDPRRRDALVARFRVLGVRDRVATALVTGQTTAVSTDHVATLEEPPRSWFRTGALWVGLLIGTALGTAVGLATK